MKYAMMMIDYDETKTNVKQDTRFTDAMMELHKAVSDVGHAHLFIIGGPTAKEMYDRITKELQRSIK